MNPVIPRGRSGRAAVAASVVHRASRLLPLIAAAASFPMLASADEPAVELDTVTVRANPLGKTSDQLVQPTTVVDGDELNRKRRGTIGETLENEPGISTTDFGAGAGRPVIRGQAGPRVEVLENGISSLDVSDVSPDHAVGIDVSNARSIEVLRGPATLIYGSRALGGVVNVLNGRLPTAVDEGFHGVLEGQYGSNADDRNGALELDYGIGHHQIHVDAAGRKAGEYDIPGNARVDGQGSQGVLANSRTQTNSTGFSYGYVRGGSSVSFAVSTFGAVYGLPQEEEAFINLDQTRYDLQGILDQPLPGIESVKFRGAFNAYDHTEFEAPEEPGTLFRNSQNQSRVEIVHKPVFGFRGVFGVQHDFRRFSAIGEEAFVPSTRTTQVGVFLIEEYAWSQGKFEAGVRVNRDTVKPNFTEDGTLPGPNRGYTPVSFSLGTILNVSANDHVKFNFSRAQRSAAAEELFAFGPHLATGTYERGLADASIETANNIEIGFDHHDARLSVEATLYLNSIRNYLYLDEVDAGLDADGSGDASSDGIADRVDEEGAFDPDGDLLLVDYRQANARFYGVEGQASYKLLSGPLKLSVRAFGDQVVGQLNSGGDLPRVTPARVGFGFDPAFGPFTASLSYTRVLAQNDIATLETRTAGYNLMNIEAAYHFKLAGAATADSELFLRARNVLDDDARRHTSFVKDFAPIPGASVYVGFRLAI
ncbi:MAG: TonB-dependent receptor [Gammaproteobacteria bacterium]|nr:TonB-dependent receptor [Gammaproteobacteria bacterium]